ncbi:MAG: hypothetical protein KatS3mg059_0650 [Thermomicrobiales bacterium]|nr:MAG: hypothetical protein KatS3mg059_0650 [Thermomicrobiales bacterium]
MTGGQRSFGITSASSPFPSQCAGHGSARQASSCRPDGQESTASPGTPSPASRTCDRERVDRDAAAVALRRQSGSDARDSSASPRIDGGAPRHDEAGITPPGERPPTPVIPSAARDLASSGAGGCVAPRPPAALARRDVAATHEIPRFARNDGEYASPAVTGGWRPSLVIPSGVRDLLASNQASAISQQNEEARGCLTADRAAREIPRRRLGMTNVRCRGMTVSLPHSVTSAPTTPSFRAQPCSGAPTIDHAPSLGIYHCHHRAQRGPSLRSHQARRSAMARHRSSRARRGMCPVQSEGGDIRPARGGKIEPRVSSTRQL